jgi:hypothetical protein
LRLEQQKRSRSATCAETRPDTSGTARASGIS